MNKKLSDKITGFTLLPNGIWLESKSKSVICWHQGQDYLSYTYKQKISKIENIPVLRSYSYLFKQTFGQIKLFNQLKKLYKEKTSQTYSLPKNINYSSIYKIFVSILLIIIFASIQYLLNQIIDILLIKHVAFLFEQLLWLFLQIILLAILFILFSGSSTYQQLSRYNHALKNKSKYYLRNNTVFLISIILFSLFWYRCLISIAGINYWPLLVIIIPLIYELYSYSEQNMRNYFWFVVYSPIYYLDIFFCHKSSKKEQKCISLALSQIDK